MKSSLVQFFSSNQVMALLASTGIFILTLFFVAKRWIGFSIAFILLLFALIAGVLINNPQFFSEFSQKSVHANEEQQNNFKKQVLEAIDNVKYEVNVEKENFQHLKNQMQDLLNQLDTQKQKLDRFIEETRHHFQTEKQVESANPDVVPITLN